MQMESPEKMVHIVVCRLNAALLRQSCIRIAYLACQCLTVAIHLAESQHSCSPWNGCPPGSAHHDWPGLWPPWGPSRTGRRVQESTQSPVFALSWQQLQRADMMSDAKVSAVAALEGSSCKKIRERSSIWSPPFVADITTSSLPDVLDKLNKQIASHPC